MALKKIALFVTLLIFIAAFFSNALAQVDNFDFADPKLKDSTLVDTSSVDTTGFELEEIKPDTLSWKVKSLPTVEKMVRSLQDSFFYAKRDFFTNTFYRSGNNFYTLSNSPKNYYLNNTRINCLIWNDFNVLPLINFFPYKNQNDNIKFSELDLKFKAPFTSITYESGSYKREKRDLYIIKNEFLASVKGGGKGIADVRLFHDSGKQESPWDNKNYYDNLALGISRDFDSFDLQYKFIKSFYQRDRFIIYYPPVDNKTVNFEPQMATFRNSYFTNFLQAKIWDDYISFSFLNQSLDNHINPNEYDLKYQNFNFNRTKLTLTGFLPIKNYNTDITLYVDNFNFDSHTDYTEIYGFFQFDTPGFWSKFYDLTISNSFTYNTLVDSFTSESEINFHLPITENLNTSLKVGVKHEPIPFFYDYILGYSTLDFQNRTFVYYDLNLFWKSANLMLQLKPFIRDITKDKDLHLNKVEEYRSYGVDFIGDYKFKVFNFKNNYITQISYSQPEKDFAFRPEIYGKMGWEIQRSLKHNNFVFLNGYLNFMGLYEDESGEKQSRQVFFSGEFGFKINRFNISVNFNNIFNYNYFLFRDNKINGFSSGIKVNWSFIN